MATRQQIARLSQRIDALADQHGQSKPCLVVVDPSETQEQAAQRSGLSMDRCIFIHTGVPRASGGRF